MRLLKRDSQHRLSLTADLADGQIPPYAVLSHTWGDDGDEVTFADLQQGGGQSKAGYQKVRFCGERARRDGIEHFWVDTCCINKADPLELSEAITSMFRWYQNAKKCYVYLSDVSTDQGRSHGNTRAGREIDLRKSRWFTRGWTLQELLAPSVVEFFSHKEDLIGTKQTLGLQIHEITTIPLAALYGTPLEQFPIAERMRWAQGRQTKKVEDEIYCLLGIFDVFMPFIYGERDNVLQRLQKEISKRYEADVAAALSNNHRTGSAKLYFMSAPLIKPSDFIGRRMGGIGKTHLASAYMRQHQHSYSAVFWLGATSGLTFYASLRPGLQIFITVAELKIFGKEQVLIWIHTWLSHLDNTLDNSWWLLILDDYDDSDLFDIKSFLLALLLYTSPYEDG